MLHFITIWTDRLWFVRIYRYRASEFRLLLHKYFSTHWVLGGWGIKTKFMLHEASFQMMRSVCAAICVCIKISLCFWGLFWDHQRTLLMVTLSDFLDKHETSKKIQMCVKTLTLTYPATCVFCKPCLFQWIVSMVGLLFINLNQYIGMCFAFNIKYDQHRTH